MNAPGTTSRLLTSNGVRLAAPLLACGLLFACGGGHSKPVPLRGPVATPDAQMEQTHAAAKRAFLARKYTIKSESDGSVIGLWQKGGSYLEAEMVYNETQVEVRYVDSNFGPAPDGMVPRRYARYMNNLRSSVDEELKRPAQDAANAEERARREAEKQARIAKKRENEEARRKRMVLIAKKANNKKVRKQIILELQDRSYTVESEEGNEITARWAKGDLFYKVKIIYSPTQVEFAYIDSDHSEDSSDEGVVILDERYITYLNRLSKSVGNRLN